MIRVNPPSVLMIPIPETRFPEQDRILLRVARAFPGTRTFALGRAESNAPFGVPWVLALEIPGFMRPVFLWPEILDGLPDEAWWVSPDLRQEEMELFAECQRGIVIETMIDGDDPRALWRRQVILAMALGEDAPFYYDDSAMRVITRAAAEDIAEMPLPPSAQDLMSQHAVYDEQNRELLWVHTHGLGRTGVPDIEAFRVRGEQHGMASQLIGIVADRQIDAKDFYGEPMLLGPGIMVELIPIEEALELLDPADVGASADDRQDHGAFRAALALPSAAKDKGGFSFTSTRRKSLRLDSLLSYIERENLVYCTDSESEKMAHMARYRWPLFLALWRNREGDEWEFLVKTAFRTTGSDSMPWEHLWFEVRTITPDGIECELINDPINVPSLKRGHVMMLQPESITDWSVSTSAVLYDPRNAARLASYPGVILVAPKPVH